MFFLPTASTKNVIINYTKKHTSLKLLFKEIKYVVVYYYNYLI